MAALLYITLGVLAVGSAAPPPVQQRQFPHYAPAPLQQLNQLDYYLDNQDVANYYSQAQQKQGNEAANGAPARLETLEPDSEVELIPGAQQPQQPPQQNPVSPNIPGLIPGGQRVFIVHMPVPGYRPGSIGGYQPVYIVAAAPQGNPGGYSAGAGVPGYQNTVLLDPSSGQVISPVLGYPRPGVQGIQQHPGLLLGSSPYALNRPFDLVYQDPSAVAFQPQGGNPHGPGPNPGQLRLSQLVTLQGQGNPNSPQTQGSESSPSPSQPKRVASGESAETKEEPRRNARPNPPHAQTRTKSN